MGEPGLVAGANRCQELGSEQFNSAPPCAASCLLRASAPALVRCLAGSSSAAHQGRLEAVVVEAQAEVQAVHLHGKNRG